MKREKNYSVGYGKPPLETRFKSGNSEHLKRRKKKKDEFIEILRALLAESVSYKVGRRTKKARRIDLQIETMSMDAIAGDIGAAALLLTTHQHGAEIGDLNPVVFYLSKSDQRL
jgi:hypothetical protein